MDAFQRLKSVFVPFNATSASTQSPVQLPVKPDGSMFEDLWFMFFNPTNFDVRLEGSPSTANFSQVSAQSGWPIAARVQAFGPWPSKKPVVLSCQAFSTQGFPLTGSEDFSNCNIEILYGRMM